MSRGKGTLYSWTVVWRAQHPAFDVPYAPGIIRLDEGYWLLSAVIGCDSADLQAEMNLAVEFHAAGEPGEEVLLPYFRPVGPRVLTVAST